MTATDVHPAIGVSVARLVARVASLLVEPRAESEPRPAVAPGATRALVIGSVADAPPLAAALAGSLRAQERAAAALLCVWTPGPSHNGDSAHTLAAAPATALAGHSGPAAALAGDPGPAAALAGDPTPAGALAGHPAPATAVTPRPSGGAGPGPSPWVSAGARRVASRLAARGLVVPAVGRLAWLSLPPDPAHAAETLLRLLGWVEVPTVTVVAGPRTERLDALIADHDLVVAVRAAGAVGEALAALALDGVGIEALACDPVPAGLARWWARAGLSRLPTGHPALDALARRVA